MCIIVTTDHTTAMTTRYRYRWEDARAAYLAGDLTIKEFHAARSREFSLSDFVPSYNTMTSHFSELKRGQKKSHVRKTCNLEIARIKEFDKADSIVERTPSSDGAGGSGGPVLVTVTLPSGGRIEFATFSPELFAMAALGRL